MGKANISVITSVFLLLLAQTLSAEQLKFSARQIGEAVDFEYTWKDAVGREINTEFMLNTQDVKLGYTEFKAFKKEAYEQKLLEAMIAEGNKIGKLLNINVKVQKTPNGFSTTANGPPDQIDKAINYLNERKPIIESEIFKDGYFTSTKRGNIITISPDYKTIAARYADVMFYVAKSLLMTAGPTMRSAVTHYLNFIRSIPYSTEFTNGAQYQTPVGMLMENKGDCDTKAIALAALMQNFDINVIFVLLPEHMLVGIEIPAESGDATLVVDGRTYVLAEASGPALLPLGELAPLSSQIVQSGNYSILSN